VTNGSFEFAETNNAGGGAAIALAGVPAMPIGDYTVVLGGFTADSLQDSWGSLLNVGDTPNDYGIYVRKTTDASGKSMNTLFFYGYSGTGASGGSLVEDQRYDIIVSRASSGRIRAWLDGVQVIEVLDTYGFFGIAGSLFFGRDDAGENITAGQLEYIKIYSGGLTTYDAGLLGEPTAAAPEPSALALLAAALASPALYRRRRAS
jgi:hypothetical protein